MGGMTDYAESAERGPLARTGAWLDDTLVSGQWVVTLRRDGALVDEQVFPTQEDAQRFAVNEHWHEPNLMVFLRKKRDDGTMAFGEYPPWPKMI